jgi:thioredoxin-related protein
MKNILFSIILIISFFSFGQKEQQVSLINASEILKNACSEAKIENKNIFLKYSASWCGWCKKMDEQIKSETCNSLFESNYIFVTLVVNESKSNKHLETPGGQAILEQYNGERSGLPFFVILNEDGNLLEDSFDSNGQNLGCPVSGDEVTYFVEILKNTSSLNTNDLNKISTVFLSK